MDCDGAVGGDGYPVVYVFPEDGLVGDGVVGVFGGVWGLRGRRRRGWVCEGGRGTHLVRTLMVR